MTVNRRVIYLWGSDKKRSEAVVMTASIVGLLNDVALGHFKRLHPCCLTFAFKKKPIVWNDGVDHYLGGR